MTDISESVEPSEVNPPSTALDRVSDNDETDSALDALTNSLMGSEPAEEPAAEEVEDKPEAKAEPEEEKAAPTKVKIGDEEIDLDELKNGYMKEKDYRQKTQALAEERRKIAAYEQHIKNLESDPAYVAHVKAYHQKIAEAQAPQPPDDPVEAFKWEIKQEAKRELLKELSPQIQQLQAKQTIDSVKAQVMRDPLYDETQAAILHYVQSQPEDERELIYQLLDTNPAAYQKRYAHARRWVEEQKAKATTREEPAEEKKKEPVARRERAPLLESAGRTVPTASEESGKAEKLTKIRKTLKQGQGLSEEDLFEYLDLSGITARIS